MIVEPANDRGWDARLIWSVAPHVCKIGRQVNIWNSRKITWQRNWFHFLFVWMNRSPCYPIYHKLFPKANPNKKEVWFLNCQTCSKESNSFSKEFFQITLKVFNKNPGSSKSFEYEDLHTKYYSWISLKDLSVRVKVFRKLVVITHITTADRRT